MTDVELAEAPSPNPRRALTPPRLMRELRAHISHLSAVMSDLSKLQRGERTANRDRVSVALACAVTDSTYPPVEVDELIKKNIEYATQGKLDKYAWLALDLIEQAIAVAHTAREGIRVLDALGEPLPPQWSNLPIQLLAREVNRYVHAKLRGRLPSWKEAERG